MSSVEAAARFAHDVSLVFNSAGCMTRGCVLRASVDDIRSDVETRYFGVLNVMRAFAGVI